MDLQPLYDEFGRQHVGIVRRELTMQTGHIPSYLELLTELCLRAGWQTPPPALRGNQPSTAQDGSVKP